jgi:hypothetical protein
MRFNWSVLYTIENIFSRAIGYFPCIFKTYLIEKYMGVQSFGTLRILVLGLPLGSPREK